jgi:hypothetical protein
VNPAEPAVVISVSCRAARGQDRYACNTIQ